MNLRHLLGCDPIGLKSNALGEGGTSPQFQ